MLSCFGGLTWSRSQTLRRRFRATSNDLVGRCNGSASGAESAQIRSHLDLACRRDANLDHDVAAGFSQHDTSVRELTSGTSVSPDLLSRWRRACCSSAQPASGTCAPRRNNVGLDVHFREWTTGRRDCAKRVEREGTTTVKRPLTLCVAVFIR